MDTTALLPEFAKYGVAGLLMGVIVVASGLLLRHILTRSEKNSDDALKLLKEQMTARETDLQWCRAELATKRKEFTEVMTTMQEKFIQALSEMESRSEKATNGIIARLEQLERVIDRRS